MNNEDWLNAAERVYERDYKRERRVRLKIILDDSAWYVKDENHVKLTEGHAFRMDVGLADIPDIFLTDEQKEQLLLSGELELVEEEEAE